MKRPLRLLLKLAAVFVALFVLAVALAPLVLKRYFPPEKIRELIVSNAQITLKREVRLGDISLSLLKGLSVGDLAISESPSFSAGTFAAMRSFSLKVQWLPLLRKKVVVDSVSVDGLRLNVVKKADGLFNFSDIAGSTSAAKTQAAGGLAGAALEFNVRRGAVTDGGISYKDAGTGESWEVSGLNAKARNFGLDGPFQADLSLKAAGRRSGQSIDAALVYSGRINLGGRDPARMSLEMKKMAVECSGLRLQAAGSLENLASPKMNVRVSVAAQGQELMDGELAWTFAPPGPKSPPAASGQFNLKTPGFKGSELQALAALQAFGAPAAALGAAEKLAVPALKASGKFNLKGDSLELGSLHVDSQYGALDAAGTVSNIRAAKPVPDLKVSAKLDLSAIKGVAASLARLPPGFAEGSVEVKVHLRGDDVAVESLHVKAGVGTVDASGRVWGLASGRPEPELNVTAKLSIPELKSADVAFLKDLKIQVPAELRLPPMRIDAKLHYTGDELSVGALHLENEWGNAEASGGVRRLKSAKPEGTLNASVSLRLPQVTARELSALKMIPKLSIPDNLSWPATQADAQFSYNGVDLDMRKLHVKNSRVSLDATGTVRKLATAPEPSLNADLKADLPAFASADVAFFPGVPPDLRIPAANIEARISGGRDAVEISLLRLAAGKNRVALKGSVKSLRSGSPFFSMAVDCPAFVLEELTDFSPQTREMGLKGVGRFRVFIAGEPSHGAAYTGDMEFRGIRMALAGLKLSDFTGSGKFDERLINFPSIQGKIDGGSLAMDLSIKNYLKSPAIDIQQVKLDTFDLGKFLAAKESLSKPAAGAKPAAPPAVKPFSFKVWDGFTVGRLVHPNAVVENANLKCDLSGITPDFKQLSGTAQFQVGGGHLVDIDKIARQYPLFRAMTVPILVMRGIGLFPNLQDIGFSELSGDYLIADGVVDVKEFHLAGEKLSVRMNRGRVDLPGDKVSLDVSVKAGIISKNQLVCGSISSPKTACKGEPAQ